MKKTKKDCVIRVEVWQRWPSRVNKDDRLKIYTLHLKNISETVMLRRAFHYCKWHIARLKSRQEIGPIMFFHERGEKKCHNSREMWRVKIKYLIGKEMLKAKNPRKVFVKGYGPMVAKAISEL